MQTISPTRCLKYVTLIFLFALGFLFLSGNKPEKPNSANAQDRPPNILFLIADDWSYPHAGIYGDKTVRTPTFDWLAENGALFENAYCAAPSCSPSRASILLGRYPHQIESAGNLWSVIPDKFPNWVSLLQEAGYHSGKSRKGWAPGDFKAGGYTHNPAGRDYTDFNVFLQEKNEDRPFVYWFGSQDPHRTYETNTGVKTGMDPASVQVPEFLPDTPCVRNDIMDYFFEVERFDRESGSILATLREKGLLENTLIVMTSDNGMPFPRAKANLYDYGTRMPLAIYWKGHIEGGRRLAKFVNFIDFGPTFLQAAGLDIPKAFRGSSLLELFDANPYDSADRNKVFLERERHANVRKGDLSYPSRAVRTENFLYIKNFEPDRWPAGDPEGYMSVGQYGDVDNSISKFAIMSMEGKSGDKDFFQLSFGKRPMEELYVLANDPFNLKNEAENPKYEQILKMLRNDVHRWMQDTNDLRVTEPQTEYWDKVRYVVNDRAQPYDVQKRMANYKMLLPKGGIFKETNCD